ncbi:hypothetical protein [Aridibaculum aurantiacum]|uniref:hypothetical protein n=1 Tax=Aridibaculum aurantiacum TaxID=2810307 RepID=UPI001A977058|nr:hypothetical protein [Aridibaculum aurantiacum]
MKKKMLLLLLVLAFVTALQAQYSTEKIDMKLYWGGHKFTVDEKKVSTKQVLEMMKPIDTAAYRRMKLSSANNNISTILGGVGGLLIGYPLGRFVVGEKPQWAFAAVGAALAGISIPISNKSRRQASEALELYNSKVTFHPSRLRPALNLVAKGNAIGLVLKF